MAVENFYAKKIIRVEKYKYPDIIVKEAISKDKKNYHQN